MGCYYCGRGCFGSPLLMPTPDGLQEFCSDECLAAGQQGDFDRGLRHPLTYLDKQSFVKWMERRRKLKLLNVTHINGAMIKIWVFSIRGKAAVSEFTRMELSVGNGEWRPVVARVVREMRNELRGLK